MSYMYGPPDTNPQPVDFDGVDDYIIYPDADEMRNMKLSGYSIRSLHDVLTVGLAARALNISESTVRREIKKGKMPHSRIGVGKKSCIRITWADLDEYLKKCGGTGFGTVSSNEGVK